MNLKKLPDQYFRNGINKYIPTIDFDVKRILFGIFTVLGLFFVLMWMLGGTMGTIAGEDFISTANEFALSTVILAIPFLTIIGFYCLIARTIKTTSRHGKESLFGSAHLPKTAIAIFAIFVFVWYKYVGQIDCWTVICGFAFVFFVCDIGITKECNRQNAFEYIEYYQKEFGIFIPDSEKIKSVDEAKRIVQTFLANKTESDKEEIPEL